MSTTAKLLPLSGIALVAAAAWAYLLTAGMAIMSALPLMWAIMMIAMMLPSALPAVARLAGMVAMLRFTAGYTAAWVAFALAAAWIEWRLDAAGLLPDGMALGGGAVAGALLVAVGLYQLTPLLAHDLERCRTNTGYVVSCLRCCAPLMLVLFAVGVMNVAWWVILALFVLAEKASARGVWLARLGGSALVIWGGLTALTAR